MSLVRSFGVLSHIDGLGGILGETLHPCLHLRGCSALEIDDRGLRAGLTADCQSQGVWLGGGGWTGVWERTLGPLLNLPPPTRLNYFTL